MDPRAGRSLRRILVALEAGEPSREALEDVARLAAALRAELVGFFVEDSDMLAAAALPFARIVSSHAPVQALSSADIERVLKIRSNLAEKALTELAQRFSVKFSFRSGRGLVADQLLAAAHERDLLALGATAGISRHSRGGVTAWSVARQASCSVLLLNRPSLLKKPICLIFEGSLKALELARAMAKLYRTDLLVLVVAEDGDAVPGLERVAREWLEGHAQVAKIRALPDASNDTIASSLRAAGPGLVVFDRDGAVSNQFFGMLGELPYSFVVVTKEAEPRSGTSPMPVE